MPMPMQFRAKKPPMIPPSGRDPGKPGSSMADSAHPMMRSNTVMGSGPTPNMKPRAGISAMVAPTPNGRMMANGGIAGPGPIGGGGAAVTPPPSAPGGGPEPDGDEMGSMGGAPMVTPEMVGYHDDPQACAGVAGAPPCMHFQERQCALLQMEVAGPGGCRAYQAGQGGDEMGGGEGAPPPGDQPNDDGTGTSGGY